MMLNSFQFIYASSMLVISFCRSRHDDVQLLWRKSRGNSPSSAVSSGREGRCGDSTGMRQDWCPDLLANIDALAKAIAVLEKGTTCASFMQCCVGAALKSAIMNSEKMKAKMEEIYVLTETIEEKTARQGNFAVEVHCPNSSEAESALLVDQGLQVGRQLRHTGFRMGESDKATRRVGGYS